MSSDRESKRARRLAKLANKPVGDLVLGPKLHQDTLSESQHYRRINQLADEIRRTGKVPTGIKLNIVDDNAQIVDGRHRAIAVQMVRPETKIGEISDSISDVLRRGKNSSGQSEDVGLHILASFAGNSTEVPTYDGPVKKVRGDTSYTSNLFSDNSKGRSVRTTAADLEAREIQAQLLSQSYGYNFGETMDSLASEYKYTEGTHRSANGGSGSGGSSSLCYVSTACVEELGKPDDCEELQSLRSFRDTFVAKLPTGRDDIAYYYKTAPGVLDYINRLENNGDVLREIYDHMVIPTLNFIAAGQSHAAYAHYRKCMLALSSFACASEVK